MTKIFVAGEGAGEIGKWVESRERRATSERTNGVLFELYARRRDGGEVIDGMAWSKVRKYRAGGHATADQRTLRQLAVLATEAGAEVLLWSRDSDHDSTRGTTLSKTNQELKAEHAGSCGIVGGVVEPCLEAWIIGIKGLHATPEKLAVPRLKKLAAENHLASEEEMVAVVQECRLEVEGLPSLARWLAQLESAPFGAPGSTLP